LYEYLKLTCDFLKEFAENQLRRFFAAFLKNHFTPKQVSVRSALAMMKCCI